MSALAEEVRELGKAVELVRAAYGEAMQRAGLFKGKVAEIHGHADRILAELDDEDASSAGVDVRQAGDS